MAAGMAREQSAGVLCAVLVEEGSAADKVLGSLGLLVISIIHGVKANPASYVRAIQPKSERPPGRDRGQICCRCRPHMRRSWVQPPVKIMNGLKSMFGDRSSL
jgi:hypothetical protein